MNIPGYDARILAGPREEYTIGQRVGEDCLRLPEPDEDAPRGYKPKPCDGVMVYYALANCSCHQEIQGPCPECSDNILECTKCGELAQ